MKIPWIRPASVKLGQVWSRFKGRDINGKQAQNYQIRDMDMKRRNQCLELMVKTFMNDEPLCRAFDLKSDPVSVKSLVTSWEKHIDQKVSLACYTENGAGYPDKLVAFNVLVVKRVDDEEHGFMHMEGEPWKKAANVVNTAEKLVNIFDHYGVDKYMSTSGLTVQSSHRGQNIGARMMEARKLLSRSLGIPVISTVFTAITSQVLAAKCGYEKLAELQYKDVEELRDKLKILGSPSAKVMGLKFKL